MTRTDVMLASRQRPQWRLSQTALLHLLLAISVVFSSTSLGRAQELDFDGEFDVAEFGDLDGLGGDEALSVEDATALDEPAAPAAAAEEAESDEDELEGAVVERSGPAQAALDAINRQDPQTPSELLKAVSILQQLGAYDDALPFLERVTTQQLDTAALAKVHDDLGPALLLQIASDKSLPAGSDLVREVFAATNQVQKDPRRLQELVGALATVDPEARRVTMAELAKAESRAVPVLLNALRNPPENVTHEVLLAALVALDGHAEKPLVATLGSPDPGLQQVAALTLGRIDAKSSIPHLIRPYFSSESRVQSATQWALKSLVGRYPSSVDKAANYLRRRALQYLQGDVPRPTVVDGTLEMWTWNASLMNVEQQLLSVTEANAVMAGRFARDAYELDPSDQNPRLLLVSRLQADQLLGGVDGMLPKGPGSAYEIGRSFGLSAAVDALDFALSEGHEGAAIGATELIGDLCEQGVDSKCWRALSRALSSPARRVRHAAARSIMTIDPRQSYPGSSFMMETLLDLAEASGRSSAIVATPRTELRDSLSGMLNAFGFRVHATAEGRPCLREALRASDYDVILLSDSVSRPTIDETLQQLRKDPQGKQIPVILMVRQDRALRSSVLSQRDGLVVTMPEFADETTLTNALERAEQLVGERAVSPQRRIEQARDALTWLGHLAQYSKSYPQYDVMRAGDVALQASTRPTLMGSAFDLMGYLGDHRAQKRLATAAGQISLSSEGRQRAANAFAQAVLRRGLLLRQAEIYAQYDRYNASANEDQQTQEILGQILDVIETQTKPASLSAARE